MTFNPFKLRRICICQQEQIKNLNDMLDRVERDNKRLKDRNRELFLKLNPNGNKEVENGKWRKRKKLSGKGNGKPSSAVQSNGRRESDSDGRS